MGIKHMRKRVLGICVAVCLAVGLAGIAYAQTQGTDGDGGTAAADDEVSTVQASPFVEGGIRSTGVDANRVQALDDGTLAACQSDETDMSETPTSATNCLSAPTDTGIVAAASLDDDESNGDAATAYSVSAEGGDDNASKSGLKSDDQGGGYIGIAADDDDDDVTSDIVVTVKWDDVDNNDGKRPNSISVYLLANGEQDAIYAMSPSRSTVTVSDDGNTWEYTFADKPVYKDGEEIEYTLTEDPVTDYETTVKTIRGAEVNKDGKTYQPYSFEVTNTHELEETTVEGSKTWDDDDNNDNMRPDSIMVRLLADGEEFDSATVTEDDDWSWSFDGLPKYLNGNEVVYTITEDAIEEYSATYDGFDVTNSYTPGKTSVTVTAAWNDDDDEEGARPPRIEVELLADGEPTGTTLNLNSLNDWTNTFTDLDIYKSGQKVEYGIRISETVGEGYDYKITGDAVEGFVITGTYGTTINLSGTVTWDDDDNANNTRPESVMIHVLADGEEVDSVTVTADDDWTWSLEGLPRYDADGAEIEYTITQDAVSGYTTAVDGYNVANTYAADDAGSGTGGGSDDGTEPTGGTETGTADSTGTSTTGSTGTGSTGSTGGTGGTSTGIPTGSSGTGTTGGTGGTGGTGSTGGASTPTSGTGSTTSTATTPSSGTAASNPASGSSSPANSSAIPQTGDTTPTTAWIVLALIALTTAALAVVQMRRNRHRDKFIG